MKWQIENRSSYVIKHTDRWDSLIQYHCQEHSGTWKSADDKLITVEVPYKLIKSQVKQESDFNPDAVSPVGAGGLLQLMPSTATEMGVADVFNPDENLRGGILYLIMQYLHMLEIDSKGERWKFALSAYNGGRGYINKALELARQHGDRHWQEWHVSSEYLKSPFCVVNGKTPDHNQITNYVDTIWARFLR